MKRNKPGKRSRPPTSHQNDRATPRPPPPVLAPTRPAERAWVDHVGGMYREGPERWADLTERFVTEREPGDASRALAVLLLATDLAYDMNALRAGSWIPLVTTHVHVHYDGEGYGPVETLDLLERFVVWLAAKGEIAQSDLAGLRSSIDDARESVVVLDDDDEHCLDVDIPEPEVALLVSCFAAERDNDAESELAAIAIGWLAAWLRSQVGDVDFEALDPEALAAHAYEEDFENGRRALATWSVFYRWLGQVGVLDPDRARSLASRLAAASLPLLPTGTS